MTKFNELPEILTAKDISSYLSISRRRVYELFQLHPEHGGIANFEIGFSKRVLKDDLALWIKNQKKKKEIGVS